MKHNKPAAHRRKNPTPAELERRRLRDHARLERAWRELCREVRQ